MIFITVSNTNKYLFSNPIGYSPYQQSPSPSTSSYQLNHMETPSPTAYSPNTPGVSAPYSPYNPQTPGANLESHLGDWCTTDISVKIRSHTDLALVNQCAIIRTVTNMVCSVFLPEEDRTVAVESDQLEPIPPNVGDHFKVILGDDRESTGIVTAIEGNRAVCIINEGSALKALKELCLMQV